MTATYNKFSPYYSTAAFGQFLDILEPRHIPKVASDTIYTIDVIYTHRPDMLAYDLYGFASLWWVFAARNPNVIADPIFDFFTGQTIYIPAKETLVDTLGI